MPPTATSALVGLYADSSGHPGALLTQGTITNPPADAWSSVAVAPTTVAAGTTYWIAVLVPSGGGTLSFRDGSATPPSGPAETASSTTLTALPAQWTTGAAFADSPISATAESAAAPSVGLAPTSFSFATTAGGSATAQTLHLTNLGGGILDWSIASDASWVSAIPAGSYTANLTISAPGADNPTTIVPVTLTVNTTATGDTIAPTIALTAPSDGSTVSGPVPLSATASDNVGVVGVQFTVDGGGAGAELTASPYGLTWDSTLVPDGVHHISAVARDAAGNVSTAPVATVTVQNSAAVGAYGRSIDIGPGFTDPNARQVVRTADDRVYVLAADDTPAKQSTGPGIIHAYRATTTGLPAGFAEADAAHRPKSTQANGLLPGVDVRLDGAGVAHVVYADDSSPGDLVYVEFSTRTDTWGQPHILASGLGTYQRGQLPAALILDGADQPHVVYTDGSHLDETFLSSGTWSSLSRQTPGKPISRLRMYKSFAMPCGEMTPCASVS